MKEKAPLKTHISKLEAKIRRLEEEKEILNRAIDLADELFNTEVRKPTFLLAIAVYPYSSVVYIHILAIHIHSPFDMVDRY